MKISGTLYGNCCVLSPEGILMFRCNEKKANWYLSRSLATVISNYPLTIKLNFKPNGLGNHNKNYGLSEMENKCVNCGTEKSLTKHHVIPISYRRYFPNELKSHNFHDVLLMCADCHETYERKADELKQKISIEYDSPLNGVVIKCELGKYVKMSNSLLKNNLPKSRKKELIKSIKFKFNIKRLTKKKLEMISKIKSETSTITHGEMVMSKISDLNSFIKMWRQHFIENNDLKYLPKNWDITNGLK